MHPVSEGRKQVNGQEEYLINSIALLSIKYTP